MKPDTPSIEFHYVSCVGETSFTVIRGSDNYRIGSYPSADLAHRIVKNLDAAARIAFVKQPRAARKGQA